MLCATVNCVDNVSSSPAPLVLSPLLVGLCLSPHRYFSIRGERIHLMQASYSSAADEHPLKNMGQIFVRGRIVSLKRGANTIPWTNATYSTDGVRECSSKLFVFVHVPLLHDVQTIFHGSEAVDSSHNALLDNFNFTEFILRFGTQILVSLPQYVVLIGQVFWKLQNTSKMPQNNVGNGPVKRTDRSILRNHADWSSFIEG